MSEITDTPTPDDSDEPQASAQLLASVYDELRKLAAAKMAQEKPGQTLQATALVHEAYMRLVGSGENAHQWENRAHFFAAAAEAIRRILVENARRKGRLKRGGNLVRHDIQEIAISMPERSPDILALDEALRKLGTTNEVAARLVTLRFFVGLSNQQAAEFLDVSPRKADQIWAYARAWLLAELEDFK